MKRIYIAGPMSGYPNHNYPAFDGAAAKLRAAGFHPISPADVSRAVGIHSDVEPRASEYCDLLLIDIEIVEAFAHGIALLDGWEDSRGTQIEIASARDTHNEMFLIRPLAEWLAEKSREETQ